MRSSFIRALFGLLICLVLGTVGGWLTASWIYEDWLGERTLGFAPVQGSITTMSWDERRDRRGRVHSLLRIQYQYTVGNRTFKGDRYYGCGFNQFNSAERFDIERWLYVGAPVTAYVSPTDPADAVLVRGPAGRAVSVALVTGFAMMPAVLGLVLLVDVSRRRSGEVAGFVFMSEPMACRVRPSVLQAPQAWMVWAAVLPLAGPLALVGCAAVGVTVPARLGFTILWPAIAVPASLGIVVGFLVRRAPGRFDIVFDRQRSGVVLPVSARPRAVAGATIDAAGIERFEVEHHEYAGRGNLKHAQARVAIHAVTARTSERYRVAKFVGDNDECAAEDLAGALNAELKACRQRA